MPLAAYQPSDRPRPNRRSRSGLVLESCRRSSPQFSTYNHQLFAVASSPLLLPATQPLVLVMRPNSEPFCFATFHNGEGAIVVADARRHLLEVQKGMTRVARPQFEILSGEAPDLWWQLEEPATKAFRRRGIHPAARRADPCFRLRGADKPRGAFRFGRLPRSVDPIPGHDARAN